MLVIDAARVAKRGFTALRQRTARADPEFDEVKTWIDTIRDNGICVVPNFYSPSICEELRRAVLDTAERYPDAVHAASNGADRRIFGAERATAGINAFAEEPRLLNTARVVLGADAANALTLAATISYMDGNLGSGEGWHRDSFFNQFKAIVYLTDVTEENGPFEYIIRSHLLRQKLSDSRRYGIPLHTRLDDSAVRNVIAAEPDRHRILTAPMGTLILADTTGIHRGMPLKRGQRFALTNYYLPGKAIGPQFSEYFSPVLGLHVPLRH
ncbi:phytanoyl-CoA dioxygenase family protein [Mycolicibacterium sp.]|uniref:phytanoyl-CoA dioxygenase family protein n=1 Tax=Mycolicibacterium sp. TaxID=2320850 RepID=UPI0025FF457C|nr:phytanoyl-CoA dioxygenase family protein [Mycolicibacterium sp.]MCB9409884.1 phytanoyl-CoA dioxygenase family protein [Mycolicibacterium sp.]